MRFCSIVCAVSLSASIQLLISFFVIILVSIIWNRRDDPRISPQEMASLPTPAPASSPAISPPPSHPEQPDQVKEEEEKEEYPVARLPYKEDTIVTLVSDIYRIYVQLGYMNNRADGMEELAWPPPGGHAINEAICQELNLSPKVISLMRRLPYPVSYHIAADLPFKEWSTAFAYIEDRQIRDGRDPGRWIFDEPRTDFLLPHEIALAGADDEGIHLILDTDEIQIRSERLIGNSWRMRTAMPTFEGFRPSMRQHSWRSMWTSSDRWRLSRGVRGVASVFMKRSITVRTR
ncbi:uncharacterized protein BO95DRAFT_441231 [Aspergillus brunneoviolaceus CBS 621.78]|uniref:Uncharacterized protein n=1 Tax=Aspergillus brunneoviolaceus CBS 621.78 TaxID=1450534 RepID=A0ACD1GDZ4_9EURO|nr:hypothetical protein BO95DRAFT_441231 [Aspergillus brunneoviolaceus CBS 621.78]RAH47410.1 hypothetical protein BO95DRAFT_441231 [Aspergillus brunneoviolaceus CBS 621.78]